MVVVEGVTYRIERNAPHHYSVVRLLDDLQVGTFCTLPALRVHPLQVEVSTLRDIVRAALKSARTSSVMHAAPVFQPDDASSATTSSSAPPPRAVRSPSSAPPPAPAMA